jgi:death-on-curing protein
MNIKYLTVADVIAYHDEVVIKEFGGSYGILNENALESALLSPQQAVFGEELYPDLPAKAGILFFLLVQNHCFLDGNKRTAMLSLIVFLRWNRHTLAATEDELFQLAIEVATAVLNKDQTIEWLRAHLRPFNPIA